MSSASVLDLIEVQDFLQSCQTGDILLFNSHSGGIFGIFTTLIKYFTSSQYSHIAMVLRDPTYFGQNLQGLYVWESSYEGKPDPQDGKIKVGVQITKMETILQEYYQTGGVAQTGKALLLLLTQHHDDDSQRCLLQALRYCAERLDTGNYR